MSKPYLRIQASWSMVANSSRPKVHRIPG